MKIIHCADIHLDSKMESNLPKDKAKERNNEILESFINMVNYGHETGVETVIIAGDLFDRKRVTAKVIDILCETIKTHPHIAFYYLKGNHDGDGLFKENKPDNLYLFDKEWKSYRLGNRIVLTGAEFTDENSNRLFDSLNLNPRDINIVTLHGQVGEYTQKDKGEYIPLKSLKNKGIDYLALGHVHQYHMEKLDSRGWWCYPGCLEGRGFDECGQHGFVVIDVDQNSATISHNFIEAGKRQLYTIEIDISGCENTLQAEKIIETSLGNNYRASSLLKLVLTGQVDSQIHIDIDFLTNHFGDQYYFCKIYDNTREKLDLSALENEISLRGEFIRKVKENSNIDDCDKDRIIAIGLRALAGE